MYCENCGIKIKKQQKSISRVWLIAGLVILLLVSAIPVFYWYKEYKAKRIREVSEAFNNIYVNQVIDSANQLDPNAKVFDIKETLYWGGDSAADIHSSNPAKSIELICNLRKASNLTIGLDGELPSQYKNQTIRDLFDGKFPIDKNDQEIRNRIKGRSFPNDICK